MGDFSLFIASFIYLYIYLFIHLFLDSKAHKVDMLAQQKDTCSLSTPNTLTSVLINLIVIQDLIC